MTYKEVKSIPWLSFNPEECKIFIYLNKRLMKKMLIENYIMSADDDYGDDVLKSLFLKAFEDKFTLKKMAGVNGYFFEVSNNDSLVNLDQCNVNLFDLQSFDVPTFFLSV